MSNFKFLSKPVPAIPEISIRTLIYDRNGTYIITIRDETLSHGFNRIECENFAIRMFRWSRNFNQTQILGPNYESRFEIYEGPIGSFFNEYYNQFRMREDLHINPVIERIDYSGSSFFTDSLKFSFNHMNVRITYKSFHETI